MKHTILSLKSLAITAAGCALLGISATAFAVPIYNPQPFTVDEGGLTGTPSNQFDADKFTASYNEIFTAGAGSTFAAKAVFGVQGYSLGGSAPSTTYINSPEPDGYKIYGILASSGTFSTSGTVTTINGTNNSLTFYVDLSGDTTYTVPDADIGGTVSDGITRTNTSDDLVLASSTTGIGQGSVDNDGSLAPGNFGILFSDFTLSSTGLNYFIAPTPFYMKFEANGNFNPFTPAAGTSFNVNGGAEGFFAAVPGPGSLGLAMLGLALLGLGFITKRSQSDKSM